MGRLPSKKSQQEAALLCDVMASSDGEFFDVVMGDLDVKWSSTAARIAARAQYECSRLLPGLPDNEVWAEAAALVRSGWRVGERAELLPVDDTVQSVADYLPLTPEENAFLDEEGKALSALDKVNAQLDRMIADEEGKSWIGESWQKHVDAEEAELKAYRERTTTAQVEPARQVEIPWDDRAGEYGSDS